MSIFNYDYVRCNLDFQLKNLVIFQGVSDVLVIVWLMHANFENFSVVISRFTLNEIYDSKEKRSFD